jgi:uncharacterized protein HemX
MFIRVKSEMQSKRDLLEGTKRLEEQARSKYKRPSEKGQAQLLLAIIIGVVVCGVVAGLWGWVQGQVPSQTTGGNISMIQPQGANPRKDFSNSQTNLNNSEANLNNAEAQSVPKLTDAEVEVMQAEACKLRNDCAVQTYLQGERAGVNKATGMFGLGTVGAVLFVIVIVLFVLGAKK